VNDALYQLSCIPACDLWLHFLRCRSGGFATTALTWHDVEAREYGDSVFTIGHPVTRSRLQRDALEQRLPHYPTCSYVKVTNGKSRVCS
jgi:hypothetical protein